MPDEIGRLEVLRIHTKNMKLDENVELELIGRVIPLLSTISNIKMKLAHSKLSPLPKGPLCRQLPISQGGAKIRREVQ